MKYIGRWEISNTNEMGEYESDSMTTLKQELLSSIKIYGNGRAGSWAIYTNDEKFDCKQHGNTRKRK